MRKIKNSVLLLTLIMLIGAVFSVKALAATCDLSKPSVDASGNPVACTCPSGYDHPLDDSGNKVTNICKADKTANQCPSQKVDKNDPTSCVPLGGGCKNTDPNDPAAVKKCLQNNAFVSDLNDFVNFLSASVGIVVIIIIIIGAIQYSLAGDNANAQAEAKTRITNALIALVAFIFTFAFLQWLIPGGL